MQHEMTLARREWRALLMRHGEPVGAGPIEAATLVAEGEAIDVSYHNGLINWGMVKRSKPNLKYVAIKVGGADIGYSYSDPQYERNWKGAADAGLGRIGYWFASPYVVVSDQMNYFRDALGDDRGEGRECVDVEWPSRKQTSGHLSLMLEAFNIWDGWYGYYPLNYSANWWWAVPWAGLKATQRNKIDWRRMTAWVGSYTLWPVLYEPFTDSVMWQYTDKGTVKGINAPVDLNWIYNLKALTRPEGGTGGGEVAVPSLPAIAKTKGAIGRGQTSKSGRELIRITLDGVEMEVLEQAGDYLKARVKNLEAWYQKDMLVFEPPKPEPPKPEPPKPEPMTGNTIPKEWAAVGKYLVGVWCGNAAAGRRVLQAGCRSVLIQNDVAGAAQLKREYPDAMVAVRKVTATYMEPEQFVAWMGLAADAELIVTGMNETDVPGFDYSSDGIRKRAKWDRAVAALFKQVCPRVMYAAGGWAEGNPDNLQLSAEVQMAVRDGYAQAYNEGEMLFDYHGYTVGEGKNFTKHDPYYREQRWKMLQELCGFGAGRHVISSEIGIEADKVSKGGFKAKGYTQEEATAWAQYYIKLQQELKAPVLGGFVFQLGHGGPEWGGFELDGYVGALAKVWV